MGRHTDATASDGNRKATKTVLLAAANAITLHGWVQGRGYEDGKRCITNAIGTAAMEVDELHWMDLSVAATTAVLDDLKLGTGTLAQWNDTSGRTADDVIETLRRVASQL